MKPFNLTKRCFAQYLDDRYGSRYGARLRLKDKDNFDLLFEEWKKENSNNTMYKQEKKKHENKS